ncbi:hypothetical protein NEMBOFW57_007530 [Staphylotrichum longicolle]|uniref:Uncharacterized protein n=1 Tax=Staphylotrichum longicolle TaxID=669026 RepID=A0AAD4EVA4_9PEZI|nr:hypothetical protein NEMBOFW57_007530 [Staphylotrichum longicolle]
MSLLKSYLNLTPKYKLGLGAGLLIWGFLGLHKVESKLGLTPTDADKAELERMTPRISVVPRGGAGGSGGGGEKA